MAESLAAPAHENVGSATVPTLHFHGRGVTVVKIHERLRSHQSVLANGD